MVFRKTLESLTFVNEADDDCTDKLMIADGTEVDDCSSYARFLRRFCDLTRAGETFLCIMAQHELKVLRFVVPGRSHEYAIGPLAMLGVSGNFAPFSTLSHLDLNIFPSSVTTMTEMTLSGQHDALLLAQFISSAQQLSSLKLTTNVESWDDTGYDYPVFTSDLFALLALPTAETVVLDGWERVNFREMLNFFRIHQNISQLELLNFELDARDRPQIESWVGVFKYLRENQGLTDFTWNCLRTSNDSYRQLIRDMGQAAGMTGSISNFRQQMKHVWTSSHRHACSVEGCKGVGCVIQGHVTGRLAIEGIFAAMIANFERSRISEDDGGW